MTDRVLGVVLAGGTGSRLLPLTRTINKHVLPVNGRPMLHWPLRALRLAGVRQVVVVLGGRSCGEIVEQFGTNYDVCDGYGPDVGLGPASLSYVFQEGAGGIGAALACVEGIAEFARASRLVVVLGDNVFPTRLPDAFGTSAPDGVAQVVAVDAVDAEDRYGCVSVPVDVRSGPVPILDRSRVDLVEKPRRGPPVGQRWLALSGAYSFPLGYDLDAGFWSRVRSLKESERGELEVTDLLRGYLANGRLDVVGSPSLPWIDAGDPDGYATANDPAFWRSA